MHPAAAHTYPHSGGYDESRGCSPSSPIADRSYGGHTDKAGSSPVTSCRAVEFLPSGKDLPQDFFPCDTAHRGLPPCLGHDLFEGVVANDLALYVEHLVKAEKHFTYDKINQAISQTKLLGSDSHNKPCMDVECIQEIQRVLSELDYEKLMVVIEHLSSVVGVTKKEDLGFIERDDFQHHLMPIQCCKVIQAFRHRELNGRVDTDVNCVPNEKTVPFSSLDTELTVGHAHLTPPCTQFQNPGLSLTKTQNSWISQFEIPWDKMPASLSQAILRGQRANPADRRAMVRTVVAAMQKHCPNPNRAACVEIAKVIVSKCPLTFADTTEEGEQLGIGYYSLVNQLKTRVEHVNRNNVSERIRRPRTMTETSDGRTTTKTVRCKVDSYGCTNWQPKCLPEGETVDSLEDRRKHMAAIFQSTGPKAADMPDIDNSMSLTYIYLRHVINSCPPPSMNSIEEQWPFLFTKRGLCAHFKTLTGIDICDRVGEALQTKGKRIIYFFQRQTQNRDIQGLLRDIESDTTAMQQSRTSIAVVLLLMKHFFEKEDSIFILADTTATKSSIEKDMSLPATPRLIILGNTFLSATKWMVSIDGKVAYILEEHLGFADALSVFFGCFYDFNIEYQEPACATLELIQRFFVRINPEDGTKCTAKTGVSRKTGEMVKRKTTIINNRVSSFLRQLTEFEWRNLD
ncbi:uncharacterized protein LOC127661282 [Xyrauchen texanus]|uniref:uncharacterized protein LOC127661282 n=1 Tax=Xyrauchen texanus TaxID=154827 RepID=UPI00224293CC|nr:uncharacterized protein LOC127661282 [Xyrauchen texanus]